MSKFGPLLLVLLALVAALHASGNATNDTAVSPGIVTRINLTGNDQGTNLTVGVLGTPSHGTVVYNYDGTVNYTPTLGFRGNDSFNYTLVAGALYSNDTGHYYEFIQVGSTITWTDARNNASARTLYGMRGYLATITSAAESAFVSQKLQGEGWLGASDLASEGVWRWVTGPENGTQFWSGNGGGSAVNGSYTNWNTDEPNDSGGNEDYGQFLSNGKWNDLPNSYTITAYVVEYGGMPGELAPNLSVGYVNVTVIDGIAPNITLSLVSNLSNVSTVTLNATVNDSTSIQNVSAFYTDSLLSHYRLENASGVDLANRQNLTATGSLGNATGRFGNATNFTGGYLNGSDFPPLANFTLSAWVRLNTTSQNMTFVSAWQDGVAQEFALHLLDTGEAAFSIGNGTNASSTLSSASGISTGRWIHLLGALNGTNANLYIDGQLRATASPITMGATSSPLMIGARLNATGSASGFAQGAIDEVLLWNRTLEPGEMSALLNGTSFSRTMTLADGNHTRTLWATDDWGNSNSSSINFTVDTAAPNITFSTPANGTLYVRTQNISINFSVSDLTLNGTNISVFLPNGTRQNLSTTGAFSANFSVPLLNGTYQAQVVATDRTGRTSLRNLTFVVNLTDVDLDGIPDEVDSLIGVETFVSTSGTTAFNVTVGGNSSNGTFTGVRTTLFTSNGAVLVNFTFNYSNATLNLSAASVTVTSMGIVANISGVSNKTLYLADNNFVHLCARDAPMSSLSEISSSCTGANETNMDSCLGAGTLTTFGNYTCLDDGTTIRVTGLTHSGLLGAQAPAPTSSSSSPSSGGGEVACQWSCGPWSACSPSGQQVRDCTYRGSCDLRSAPSSRQSCPLPPPEPAPAPEAAPPQPPAPTPVSAPPAPTSPSSGLPPATRDAAPLPAPEAAPPQPPPAPPSPSMDFGPLLTLIALSAVMGGLLLFAWKRRRRHPRM